MREGEPTKPAGCFLVLVSMVLLYWSLQLMFDWTFTGEPMNTERVVWGALLFVVTVLAFRMGRTHARRKAREREAEQIRARELGEPPQ